MRIDITEVRPAPEIREATELTAKSRLPGSRRILDVVEGEVAFVWDGKTSACHAPIGSQGVQAEVSKHARVITVRAEPDVYFSASGFAFADSEGPEGNVSFWSTLRFPTDRQQDHPILALMEGEPTVEAFLAALGKALEQALGRSLTDRLSRCEYAPNANHALTRQLADFHTEERVRRELRIRGGLGFVGPLTVLGVSAYSMDKRWSAEQSRMRRERERQEELDDALAQADALLKQDKKRQERILQEKEAKLEEERLELEGQKNRAEVAAALELVEEEKRQRVQAAQAEADKKRAEARLMEAKAALTAQQIEAAEREVEFRENAAREANCAAEEARQHIENLDHHIMEAVAYVRVRTGALEEEVSALREAIEQMRQEDTIADEDALHLIAEWRAYGDSGPIISRLGVVETLFTNAMLDVKVTVSKDAYVYILLKDSGGNWASLLPDKVPLMGIERSNFQRAMEPEIWPGENCLNPHLPPYWMLDDKPGYERLVVFASLDPVDPLAMLMREGVKTVRGFVNPADRLDQKGTPPSVLDYERALAILKGARCVYQETVIDHR